MEFHPLIQEWFERSFARPTETQELAWNEIVAGRDVLILEDNDEAGRKRSLEAAEALHGTAKTIRAGFNSLKAVRLRADAF